MNNDVENLSFCIFLGLFELSNCKKTALGILLGQTW